MNLDQSDIPASLFDPVSLEPFDPITNIPCTLPCGHTFSIETIETLKRANQRSCPTCRSKFAADFIPVKNIAICDMLVPKKKADPKFLKYCPTHPEETISHICTTENTMVCSECLASNRCVNHKKIKFSEFIHNIRESNHILQDRNNNLTKKSNQISDMVKLKVSNLIALVTKRINEKLDKALMSNVGLLSKMDEFLKDPNSLLTFRLSEIKSSIQTSESLIAQKYDDVLDALEKKFFVAVEEVLEMSAQTTQLNKNLPLRMATLPARIQHSRTGSAGSAQSMEERKENSMMTLQNSRIENSQDISVLTVDDNIFSEIIKEKEAEEYKQNKSMSQRVGGLLPPVEENFQEHLRDSAMLISMISPDWDISNPNNLNNFLSYEKLYIRNCKISLEKIMERIHELELHIPSLLNLEVLEIDFSGGVYDVKENKIADFIKNGIRGLEFLRSVSLNFSGKSAKITDSTLEAIGTSFGKLKSLDIISLRFNCCTRITDKGLAQLQEKMTNVHNIQSFKLIMNNCPKITDEGISSLKLMLKTMIYIQNLVLELSNLSELTNVSIGSIREGVQAMIMLQNFTFDISNSKKIDDDGLICLQGGLKCLTAIRSLKIVFSGCKSITNKGLIFFKEGLKPMTLMKNLELDFSELTEISSDSFYHFKEVFKSLPELKNVILNFSLCSRFCNKCMEDLGKGLNYIPGLEALKLNISSTDVSSKGLEAFERNFKQTGSLKILTLSAYNTALKDKSLIPLSEFIKNSRSIEELCLAFYQCSQLGDEGLSHLKEGIKVLTNLTKISLNFSYCSSITNVGAALIIQSVKLLNSVQHINFVFSYCSKLTDTALFPIREVIKDGKKLLTLGLDFTDCKKISDEGIESLHEGIKLQPNLKQLSLYLYKCSKITDKSLENLSKALEKLKDLETLSFNFTYCTNLRDEGIENLKKGIKAVTMLKELALYFIGCERLTDESLGSMTAALTDLPGLKRFTLDMTKCPRISDENFKHLQKALADMPYTRFNK